MGRFVTLGSLLSCVAGVTLAQQTCTPAGGPSATVTLTKSADATAVDACPTWTGSIAIDGSAMKDVISFSTLVTVIGNVKVASVDANKGAGVASSKNMHVTGSVAITDSSNVALVFTSVDQNFTTRNWTFTDGVPYYLPGTALPIINGSLILDNTSLPMADYTFGDTSRSDPLNITNNSHLSSISLSGALIDRYIKVSGNDMQGTTFNIDSATYIRGLELAGLLDISAKNLGTIEGGLQISDSFFGSLELQEVEDIGGTFSMKNVTYDAILMTKLTTIGDGFQIIDSPNLATFGIGLGQLSTVYGDIVLNGSFTDILLPALQTVNGSMTIATTMGMSCAQTASRFATSSTAGGNIILGRFSCTSANETAFVDAGRVYNGTASNSTTSTTPVSTTTSSNTGLTAGAGAGIGIAVVAILVAVLLGVWRWRKRSRKASLVPTDEPSEGSTAYETFGKAELPVNDPRFELQDHNQMVPGKAEAYGDGIVTELPTQYNGHVQELPVSEKDLPGLPGKDVQELYGDHGAAEMTDRRGSKTSYQGMFMGTEWRHEAPGDNSWHDRDNTSIVEETAISQAVPTTSQPQSPTIVSIGSPTSKSPMSPTTAGTSQPSTGISPLSSGGRVSHFREGVSALTSPNTPDINSATPAQSEVSNAPQSLEDTTTHQLKHHPSVSSLAPSERSVSANEHTGLLDPMEEKGAAGPPNNS